jgi:hypothetical protein
MQDPNSPEEAAAQAVKLIIHEIEPLVPPGWAYFFALASEGEGGMSAWKVTPTYGGTVHPQDLVNYLRELASDIEARCEKAS